MWMESKEDQTQAHPGVFWAPSCCGPHDTDSGKGTDVCLLASGFFHLT